LKYNADETAAHFLKQPETSEEMDAAQRAMDVCPTLAIGNDGEICDADESPLQELL
jgi:ferredoxin